MEKIGSAIVGSNFYQYVREKVYTCIKWFYRGDNQKLFFVFIGIPRSGKTTAIRNIFGEPEEPVADSGNPNQILGTELVSRDSKNSILDVRSLSSSKMMTTNAKILASLHSYLENQNYIPTIVFVTARLTDSRFVGESSEFKMALKSIRLLRNELTDTSCSNIVLLLTHADRPDIQGTKRERVQAYKNAFESVFNVEPVCIIISDTPLSNHTLKEPDEETHFANSFHGLYFDFVNSSQYSKHSENHLNAPRILPGYSTIIRELNYEQSVYQRYMDGLENLNEVPLYANQAISVPSIVDIPLAVTDKYLLTNSFGDYKSYSSLHNPSENTVYNLFSSRSKILLPNESFLKLNECMVGQKVYGLTAPVAIVTNIFPVYGDSFCSGGNIMCGRVYMKSRNAQRGINGWDRYVTYYNGEFGDDLVDKAPRIGTSILGNVVYYYVEVNGGKDPFVVDSYVCYSTGIRNILSEYDVPTHTEISLSD